MITTQFKKAKIRRERVRDYRGRVCRLPISSPCVLNWTFNFSLAYNSVTTAAAVVTGSRRDVLHLLGQLPRPEN